MKSKIDVISHCGENFWQHYVPPPINWAINSELTPAFGSQTENQVSSPRPLRSKPSREPTTTQSPRMHRSDLCQPNSRHPLHLRTETQNFPRTPSTAIVCLRVMSTRAHTGIAIHKSAFLIYFVHSWLQNLNNPKFVLRRVSKPKKFHFWETILHFPIISSKYPKYWARLRARFRYFGYFLKSCPH